MATKARQRLRNRRDQAWIAAAIALLATLPAAPTLASGAC